MDIAEEKTCELKLKNYPKSEIKSLIESHIKRVSVICRITSSSLIYMYLKSLKERILGEIKNKMFEQIMAIIFSKFYENYQPACLRNLTNPKQRNMKKTTPRHIIIKS